MKRVFMTDDDRTALEIVEELRTRVDDLERQGLAQADELRELRARVDYLERERLANEQLRSWHLPHLERQR